MANDIWGNKRFRNFLIAAGSTLGTFLVRLAIYPYLGPRQPFVLFYLAIIITASFCPLPFSIATMISGVFLANYFFTEPRFTLTFNNTSDFLGAAAYLTVGLTIALLFEHLKSQRRALDRANKQLCYAVENLQRSNRDLEQFAYIASHDLQEPLRNISSFSDLISTRYEDKLDKDGREFLHFLHKSSLRAIQLVDDLLMYSRATKDSGDFEKVDSRTAYDEAVKNLTALISEKKAKITCDDLPQVNAKKTLLTQVLQNLIANGIKFNKSPEPRIHVSAHYYGGSGPTPEWRFEVSDNGIGISPAYREKIFTIFQRLHPSDEFDGTGIGLAVCKKIVGRMGGRIWVESNLNGGSTFYFTLPEEPAIKNLIAGL